MFSWFGRVSFVPYSKVSDFAVHLKNGRLMGSVCSDCGFATFPPRADCPECLSGAFEFSERNGRGRHRLSINLQLVLNRHNCRNIDARARLAVALGIDSVTFGLFRDRAGRYESLMLHPGDLSRMRADLEEAVPVVR